MRQELLKQLADFAENEGKSYHEKKMRRIYGEDGNEIINNSEYLLLGESIGVSVHTMEEKVPLHGHNYVEIMYVYNGSMTHRIDGRTLVVRAGDVLFLNQHVKHSVDETFSEDVGVNFIILPEFFDLPLVMLGEKRSNVLADFLMSVLRIDDSRPQYLLFRTAGNPAINNLFENMIISMLDKKSKSDINQYTMGLIFLHLMNNLESVSSTSLLSGSDLFVDAAVQYINRQYQTATLTELAQNMHQSVFNLSRIIKKGTGYTFLELLQRKRFQQAVVFLEDTQMSIAEIMHAVGYENSSFFYRQFKARYGVSPRKFRMDKKTVKKSDRIERILSTAE